MFDKIQQRDRSKTNKCEYVIELTKEQVKAALTSLIINRNIQTSKRSRDKSREDKIRKKIKQIPNETLPMDISQTKSIVLGTSHLNHKQMKQIKRFVLLFNCRLLIFDDQTVHNHSITHLITDEIDENDSLICTLTKQVVFGIVQHCFILSYRWINDCLQKNVLISEEQYEIEGDHVISTKHNGPRRSRLSKRPLLPLNHFCNKNPVEFRDNFEVSHVLVMIKGDSQHFLDLTNSELGDLAWLAGGIYIEQNRFPNTVFPRQCFLLIEDDDIKNKNMFHRCIDKGLKFVRSEWLIRSIVEYRLANILHYHCDPFDTIDRSE